MPRTITIIGMAKKKALRPSRLLNTPQSVKTPEQA